ncbi:TrkH family potassium uptake protein [Histidinibacterium aquaticum]|uniref:TrkH family potassium uptake protein n=1 Tax=Histidinibacterium aquaticum TaxID=2613962 RepID=A0A5J5GMD5_9RHOB|nr:potassium transporter TrkG [Histidinibacterium aquaticum]KAA9009207.1 TrkH family potassium uptake protein [Histidinibacterium aquaticum]
MRGPRRDRRTPRQPLFVVLLALAAGAMLVPALHATALDDGVTARAFFSGAMVLGLGTAILGLALRGRLPDESAFAQLAALLAAYTVLPLVLAVPFQSAAGGGLGAAWFEMVSAFTTTGATLWDRPETLAPSLHLWRALVGWFGGLLIWVAAMAILAPLSLGGFEVRASLGRGDLSTRFSQVTRTAGPYERLDRYFSQLVPIYVGLTLALWILLIAARVDPFTAICHAMSVMATSGITPGYGTQAGGGTILAEVVILAFLLLALTRRSYARSLPGETERQGLMGDPEFQLGLGVIGLGAAALFARHWLFSSEGTNALTAIRALWGDLFTVASFLTTLGFESRYWDSATAWSGLETPGLVLLGLAIFGGGIGTTAGGVKLLRVYALYKHGLREIERLIHPSSVGGAGAEARRIRRAGALVAWIFFMLFAMSLAAIMLALSWVGVPFEDALVLAVAALANCGPLAVVAAEVPISYATLGQSGHAILGVAMVVGRVELLAIIALLNPDFWRG